MFLSLRGKCYHQFLFSCFPVIFFFMCSHIHAANINNLTIVEKKVLANNGYSAEIALHPTDGSLHVAWVDRFYDIHYAVRNYSGGWSQVNTIPDGNHKVWGVEEGSHERKCLGMCIDFNGITHIVFSDTEGDIYYLYGVLGKWNDPVRIVDKAPYSIYPDIVSVGNNLYVVYEDADTDNIYGVYRIAGSWTGPHLVEAGEYPSLTVGSDKRIYFLCRGGMQITVPNHQAKFAVLQSGQTHWQFKSGMTDPEGRTGQGPALAVANGKIYLAWSMGIDDPDIYKKSLLFCAGADEPGNSWIPRIDEATFDSWDQPYYENTGDPHPNVSVYSDGLVLHMNGGRDERFRIWDGSGWSGFRTAPWNDGDSWNFKKMLQVVNDGRTAWIVNSSSGNSNREVAVSGITNPAGHILKPPPPDAVEDLQIVTKKILDSSGFSGDVAVNPADGNVHAAWVKNGSILYSVRSGNGSWSSPEGIGAGGHTVHGEHGGWPRPCLSLDIDQAGISHLIFSTDAGRLFYLSGQSGQWQSPSEISDHNGFLIYPDIKVWQNTISVIYEYVPDQHIYTVQARNGQWESPVDLGEGNHPVFAQGKEGRLYLCYRSHASRRELNFAWRVPGFTDWEKQSAIVTPENQSGASPGMRVWDDHIYIAWNNDTRDGSDYESQLYCTIGDEPGENWLTGQGSYGPIYSEGTSDPHTRISAYSDGKMLYLNGRRRESRFAVYNGENWSITRTGPWASGYPCVDTDGNTVWIMVTSNGSTADEVSVTGISNPDADAFDFENPAPQILLNFDTVEIGFGQTYNLDLNEFVENGQSCTFTPSSVTPLPDGMAFDENSHTVSWTPQQSDITPDLWGKGPGKYLFGMTITNVYGKSVTRYFWIKVIDLNKPPTITPNPVTEAFVGEPYIYEVIAMDPEGDPLTFSLNTNPEGMSIDSHTGVISWTPGSEDEGEHDVVLVVSDPYGNSNRYSFTVTVTDPSSSLPTAHFTADILEGICPLEVTFTNQSEGNIQAYIWDFGDVETSHEEHPVHVFQSAGLYTVQLIATGPDGADTLTVPDMIQVLEPPPVAGFTLIPASGPAPFTVQFTDTSLGAVFSWHWDFDDGTESADQNPEHTYINTGWYSVKLRVAGPGGTDSTHLENIIQVGSTPPVAAFSVDTIWGAPPLTVQYNDQSMGEIESYLWDFGDNTTSTSQNPKHTYNLTGYYSVSLKVTGPWGSDSVAVDSMIHVGFSKPIAVFSADTTWGDAPLTVQFSDWSHGEISQYAWDFGDGETSTEVHPVYVYQNSGEYSVQLIVIGPGGEDTLSVHQMIHVGSTTVVKNPVRPEQYFLHPNAPNPFNPDTEIAFDLPQSKQVKITVFDLRGHRIAVLRDDICSAGQHRVAWNGLDDYGRTVASGMYVIVMEAGKYRAQRKAIFMK